MVLIVVVVVFVVVLSIMMARLLRIDPNISHIIHLLDLLNHLRIIIIIPLRQIDPFLHLIQGFLQHLGKLGGHILNLAFENFNLIFFLFKFAVLLLAGLIYVIDVFF